MNEINKNENIREELERANQALAAANLLFKNGFLPDAVSKLYYYLLYIIRALLLTKSLQPRSHEGVLRLFGLHFIKQGHFDTRLSHVFTRLMKYREEADYNPSYTFTDDDFTELKQEAETLAGKIFTHMKNAGYQK